MQCKCGGAMHHIEYDLISGHVVAFWRCPCGRELHLAHLHPTPVVQSIGGPTDDLFGEPTKTEREQLPKDKARGMLENIRQQLRRY